MNRWFYGYLPGADPMRLLLGQPTGAYMVCFSHKALYLLIIDVLTDEIRWIRAQLLWAFFRMERR
jgi:hypothetical protein